MAANPDTDFDLGPLSWVKTEIDHSLNQARENLDKLASNPGERGPVKYILTHLHQATGALAMVGLGAATRFNEELEKLVAFLETEDASRLAAVTVVAKRGIAALASYLDMLLAGEADRPMRLLAPYLELNRARGQNDANEGDLFSPDLSAPLPPLASSAPLDDAVLAKALALQRAQYQQGLLRMLKGPDVAEALRQMHAAVCAIESLQAATPNRPFWTAAAAFFDSLIFGGTEVGPASKPLFAKIDQQVKQLIDGSAKVAERLFRDLLLVVGRSSAVSERIGLLKTVYRLEPLLESPERGALAVDDEALAPLVRELRELTGQQKDAWLKYTSGNRAALEPFGKQALVLAERAGKLPDKDLQLVFVRLTEVAPALKAKAIPPSESQALEVATAMLFVESALENLARLGPDFARQARTVAERLRAVMAGEPLAPVEAIEGGLLDEMTRRAQEKLLIFQVGQEVQVNLQNIEQVLDGFFRDASKRADLSGLTAQFAQVQGALMILELSDAAALNAAVMARVQQFAEGSVDGSGEAAEMVADGLSALGLFVAALQEGAASPRAALMPALLRYGLAEREAELEVRRTGTVSPLDIDVQKQKVQALYEDWKEQPGDAARERLEKAVGALQRDAAVLADSAVARRSEEALQVIKEASSADTGVFRAIQVLAPEKPPEMPTAQVVQLVDAPGAEIDKELLEIFLEEAAEVVATIESNLGACREAPHDREALTTIRRGFHTLKGSGRMVGLTDLGEMAWQCEQVMNKWLKEEKPATPPLIDFIGLARESFARWIGELNAGGSAAIDGAQIIARAEGLKGDHEPVAASPANESQAAAPDAPAADSANEAMLEPVPQVVEAPVAEMPAVVSLAADAQPDLSAVEPPAIEPSAIEPSVIEPAPTQPPVAPAAETFSLDFASLGFTPQAAAEKPIEEKPVEEAPAAAMPDLAELFGVAPSQPAEPAQAQAGSEPAPDVFAGEPAAPPEEELATIGSVVLPRPLFVIYLGEAEQHVAVLQEQMRLLEADPMHPIEPAFMRAAHTLSSSSRTTGFESVAALSYALEKWLQDAIDLPPEFDAHRLSVTRRAVDALTAMVESVRGAALPYPREDVVEALAALREGLREARRTGEGTHIRMPGIVREGLEGAAMPSLDLVAPEGAPQPSATPVVDEPVVAEKPTAPTDSIAVEEQIAVPAAAAAALAAHAAAMPAREEQSAAFEAGKEQRKIHDDLDRDLLPVFLDEAKEILPLVSEGVRRWKAAPADHSPAGELQRHLHTLKGSARMTGLMRLGELAHTLEARIDALDEAEVPDARLFDEVEERVDRFSMSLERLARGEDLLEAEPIEVPVAAVFEHQKDKPGALAVIAAAAQEKAEREALPPELRESRAALLRVNAEMIDRFVNEAGELSIARSRIEGEMAAFRRALGDLTDNISRMRSQLREIEIASEGQMQSTIKAKEESGETFDPLEFDRFSRMQELTRFLAESLGDVITLHQGLQKNLDETELAIHAQARLNRELQQGLMGVRLVPLGNLADRFYRVVRQTAKELDKKANLEFKGTRTELDRSVLEKITAPFEHLLRNAIAHGIEKPGARVAAGKAEIGEISIDAVQRGNEVVLTVADDGAGLDFARIREKAINAGLLAPDVELPDPQLAQFIFMPGFSTASEVNQIAGRGVGMDVVKNEITSLGGRVEISSTPGRGAAFTITLPLTLAVTQAVMLRAGASVYAVPTVMVEQVQELKGDAYAEAVAKGAIEWKANRYPLRSLLPLLGEIDTPAPARQIPVLLLKSGVQRAAIRVDEIVGNREVVVKTIGPQLSRLAGIAGATVLGNGQVVLILNPVQLVHRETPVGVEVSHSAPKPAEPAFTVEQKSGAPLVMVVDDSLTVRKITSRMLAREGYEVATAKDGVDALQQLQETTPDCILLDVEMPRMDGFEFARNVRADDATRGIPIIMITSRTADKHRNHALEIGVNEYMGKPYQEDQLLALIRRYTRESALA
ncbi:MAG TPA: Hpt domain-containing protein [Usitatibacter sp.]|nr:Hpt domain-containing protein [Usitatibacter sp.]